MSCDEQPISFPSHPPPFPPLTEPVPADHATLRKLAGPGARDCGAATGPEAATAVYRCGSEALARRQPFFCRFNPGRDPSSLRPTFDGLVWAAPRSFVARDSTIAVVERRGNRAPVVTDLLPLQPLHITSGMTRPRPAGGPLAIPHGSDASGIIIVQAIVERDGRARKATLLNRPGEDAVDRAALELVTNAPFEPARLFGRPVDAIVHLTLTAGRGEVRFKQEPPDGREQPFPATVFALGPPDIRPPVMVSRGEPRMVGGEAKCRGLVLWHGVVDETGRVVAAADLSPNPDAFTRAYADAAYESTFRPATRDGVPVAVHLNVAVHLRCA